MTRHSDEPSPFNLVSVTVSVPGARNARAPRRFVTVVGIAEDSARHESPLPSLEPEPDEPARHEGRARTGSGVHPVGSTSHRASFDDEPESFAFTLSGLGTTGDEASVLVARETFGDVLDAALALLDAPTNEHAGDG